MATVSTPHSLNQPARAAGQPQRRAVSGGDGESALDGQLVADMKHEINALVLEVTKLAAQDIGPEEFYNGFLGRVVSAMAAVGGAVWSCDESGRLKLQYQVNLAQTGAEASPQASTQHAQLLKSMLSGGQANLAPPSSGPARAGGPGNPTELLLVLAPLMVEGQPQGVVEIFQRPGGAPSAQRGYLRFLVQMCDLASGYLKSRRLRQLEEHQTLWRQLEGLIESLHHSLDVRETSYTIVNEGRRLIGCDRVSLAICSGASCQIEAVSGLDNIDRRAAEVRGLARLAAAVLRTGEPMWSDTSGGELAPQIEAPFQAYVDRSHARLIAVLPLVPQLKDPTNAGDAEHAAAGSASAAKPLGALIVEQLREARVTETLRTRAEIVAHHSAAALANSIEHSSLFLLPVWKFLGQITWLFRGRALPKTMLAAGLLASGIFALATVPTDFEVAARGKLQPAERREIFAPQDGLVARVPVEHGQLVESGAVLAELTSTDLDLQLAALLGRQTTNQQRLTALSRALLDNKGGAARLAPADENRLTGEMLQLQQEAQNIEREVALVREKQRQLTIVAPQRGQVVTWKVRDLLLQRPVVRGQGLLTLANPDGPWELELYLPERRLSHVQRAAKVEDTLRVLSEGNGARSVSTTDRLGLDVSFILSSNPGQTFSGRVVEIEQVAEVRGDEGNTVLVRVAVDKQQLPPLHDQTTVTAKLNCGRTSIGYAWFCDLIEAVHAKVLFWLPS
jgi:multidrug efflux pump subunit AcrA (membrane-fusion protein)